MEKVLSGKVTKKVYEESTGFDLLGFMEAIKTGEKEESKETEIVELEDKRKLGIATVSYTHLTLPTKRIV